MISLEGKLGELCVSCEQIRNNITQNKVFGRFKARYLLTGSVALNLKVKRSPTINKPYVV